MGEIATSVPCLSPSVATGTAAITFGAIETNLIPFRTKAVVCGTHEEVDEPDILTNHVTPFPYTIEGVGSGYALCLNRGIPGPSGHPYDLIAEETIAPTYYSQRAVRFILGNIPVTPNYDPTDPSYLHIRDIITQGYQMAAEGIFNVILYNNDGTAFTGGTVPEESAFAGPANGWEAYGLAQVVLWLMLNQTSGNCIQFYDAAGNDPGVAERARLYNAYLMLRTMAFSWSVDDITCEAVEGCTPQSLAITAEGGTSYSYETSGVPPNCATHEVIVGPFEITSCCKIYPNPAIDAPGAGAVFLAADKTTVTTPGCGGQFYIRLTPPSADYTFKLSAHANIEISRVYYFRYHNSPPYPADTLRQNMGLARRSTETVRTELSINVRFTCAEEPEEPDEPETPVCPPWTPPPPPPPPPPPRVHTIDNNNNNNNNNSSNNNNASLQSALSSVVMNNLQQNLLLALLHSRAQLTAPAPPCYQWPTPPPVWPCPCPWQCPCQPQPCCPLQCPYPGHT